MPMLLLMWACPVEPRLSEASTAGRKAGEPFYFVRGQFYLPQVLSRIPLC